MTEKRRKDKLSWYRPRGYCHFDTPLSQAEASQLVCKADRVAEHAFLPFIRFPKERLRYVKEKRKVQRKSRELFMASHGDAHIYSYYSDLLSQYYEEALRSNDVGEVVLAYRKGRSNIAAAKEAFQEIGRRQRCTAIAVDVSSFFDTIDHALLKDQWAKLIGVNLLPADHYKVYRSITSFAFVVQDDLASVFGKAFPRTLEDGKRICSSKQFRDLVRGGGLIGRNQVAFGIPQGSPISAILSNVYMLPFDLEMSAFAAERGAFYRRYSDDILVIGDSEDERLVLQQITQSLERLKLEVNSRKTEVVSFDLGERGEVHPNEGLSYLGFSFDGKRVLLRSSTLARYFQRMKRDVRHAKRQAKEFGRKVYKGKILRKYTHLGRRNTIQYAYRASALMGDDSIRTQVSRHVRHVIKAFDGD